MLTEQVIDIWFTGTHLIHSQGRVKPVAAPPTTTPVHPTGIRGIRLNCDLRYFGATVA